MKCYGLLLLLVACSSSSFTQELTLQALLKEMTDRDSVAIFPELEYKCLQASSYNRASVPPRGSEGWFADSDGTGFIRMEKNNGRREWVIMEHTGPGCITRMWTPYFYYDLNNNRGPKIRIYLDGAEKPAIEEYFIELLTRGEFKGAPAKKNELLVPRPFACYTARAGDLYLPIPYAKGCKITLDDKPFYNIINYRAYPEGTRVQTWTRKGFEDARPQIMKTAGMLSNPEDFRTGMESTLARTLAPLEEAQLTLPAGNHAVRHLEMLLGPKSNPQRLRSTVLRMKFDDEETLWVPAGDFFCSGNQVNPFNTWERAVDSSGRMVCRWIMPYRNSATITLCNLGPEPVEINLLVRTNPREWTEASMHFHAHWRIDAPVPGTPFQDWNFIDIQGKGVYVGDAWTILCSDTGWWGEGDEKIYVDHEYDEARFPGHFGTGSEDYYGWAGGEVPTGADRFSMPFLSNVRVGNPANPRGYNICTRSRALDAIPFHSRLCFDMEASFGVQMRNSWDLLHYSVVTFLYVLPGAVYNRLPQPDWAAKPVMTVEELDACQAALETKEVKTE
jgi:hypothetical protein